MLNQKNNISKFLRGSMQWRSQYTGLRGLETPPPEIFLKYYTYGQSQGIEDERRKISLKFIKKS